MSDYLSLAVSQSYSLTSSSCPVLNQQSQSRKSTAGCNPFSFQQLVSHEMFAWQGIGMSRSQLLVYHFRRMSCTKWVFFNSLSSGGWFQFGMVDWLTTISTNQPVSFCERFVVEVWKSSWFSTSFNFQFWKEVSQEFWLSYHFLVLKEVSHAIFTCKSVNLILGASLAYFFLQS